MRKGQKTIKKEKERAIICGGMGLRLVSMCYFVVLLVTVCCYTNKHNLWHFDPTSNDFVEKIIFISVWKQRSERLHYSKLKGLPRSEECGCKELGLKVKRLQFNFRV